MGESVSQMPLAMPMGRFLWDVAPIAVERVQGLGSCVLYAAVRRVLLTYLLTLGVPCTCVLVVGISWFVF